MPDQLDAQHPLSAWLDAVASDRPLPAGGRVASVAAAFAAALVEKIARIVQGSPRRAALHSSAEAIQAKVTPLRLALVALGATDDDAYAAFMATRGADDEAAQREARLSAARTQVELVEQAGEVARLAAELEAKVGPALRADLATARLLAMAAAHGAYGNVTANLSDMGGEAADRLRERTSKAVAALP
jgi:formiminotetrahydrofolate cyclodeaminase